MRAQRSPPANRAQARPCHACCRAARGAPARPIRQQQAAAQGKLAARCVAEAQRPARVASICIGRYEAVSGIIGVGR